MSTQQRTEIEELLRSLYGARVRGDLHALCNIFSSAAKLQFAGTGAHSNPIAIKAAGVSEFRPLLNVMIKTFTLQNHTILSTIIDDMKAAVHWRAEVRSRIAGTSVLTELVDIIELEHDHVKSYIEFFAPCKN